MVYYEKQVFLPQLAALSAYPTGKTAIANILCIVSSKPSIPILCPQKVPQHIPVLYPTFFFFFT